MQQENQDFDLVQDESNNDQDEQNNDQEKNKCIGLSKEMFKRIQNEINNQITNSNNLFHNLQIQHAENCSNNLSFKLETISFSLIITSLFNFISYKSSIADFNNSPNFIIKKTDFKQKNIILPLVIAGGFYLSICYAQYKKHRIIRGINEIYQNYYIFKNTNIKPDYKHHRNFFF